MSESFERTCPVCQAPVEIEPGATRNYARCHSCGWHGNFKSCGRMVVNNHTGIMRDEANVPFSEMEDMRVVLQ